MKDMLLDTGLPPAEFDLNPTETRLISMRIQFMKIYALPAGGQRTMKGAVVNVPIDAQKNCLKLPRNSSDLEIVHVKLKRMVDHKTVVMDDLVEPSKIISFLKWLKINNPFYKDVVLNNDWVTQNYHSNQNFFNTHFSDNTYVIVRSILEELINNIFNEGTYDQLPYENCIQPKDPIQNFPKEVPVMDYAPGQGNTPIYIFSDPDAEAVSFPDLFPLGKGHFYDNNRLQLIQNKQIPKLTLKTYAEHRLFSADRRFAQDPEWVFFTQGLVEREAIHSSITTHLRKSCKSTTEGITLTAGLFNNHLIDTEELLSNIDAFRFMKNIKGTPSFWQKIKFNCIGMISQLGVFTWFITISFNDLIYSIPNILKLMGIEPTDELLTNLSWFRKHELLKMDPVIAVRMFDRYLHKIFSYLLERQQIFGPVEAYFGRVEFGGRGSPHLHLMLKCENAPKVGVDPLADVIRYIDKHVATHIPSKEENPEFHEIGKLQTHKHTKTCTKGNTKTECRFHFPRPVSETTMIVDTNDSEICDGNIKKADKNKGRRQKVVHKRLPGDEWVNPFNQTLLLATRSNIDVQYVTSIWDLVHYLIGYAVKAEKDVCSAMSEVKKNIDNNVNKTAREKLKELGNTFIDARSVSIQEAVYRTTSLPMSVSKPRVTFIPSDMPHQRHGMLKPKHRMTHLEDESDDVFEKGIIDRYPSRPDDLANICYKEFAINYEKFNGKITGGNKDRIISLKNPRLGKMIKRTGPQVVRSHNPSKAKDPDAYYYSKICLYYPWTEESQILGNFNTLQESFLSKYDIIKSNMVKYEQIEIETLEEILDEVQEEIRQNHVPDNSTQDLDPRGMMSHPPHNLKKPDSEDNSKVTYEEPPITDEEYQLMVASLNTQQQKVFKMVKQHVARVREGKKVDQLIHFLSGAGGVGKTFLVTALRHCINRSLNRPSSRSAVLISASTGAAAALIDGQTVHQLLQLDCQEGGFFHNKPLNSAKRDQMYNNVFQHVHYLIIDEVSMIGNTNLNQIHARLHQLYGKSEGNTYFGGINLIFVGDLFQIPPVQQTKIFDPRGLAALGTNLWKDLVSFSELTDVVRSKGDTTFTALCHRIRTGKQTSHDIELLKTRVISKLPPINQLMESMLLFSTNAKCKKHNDDCIQYLRKITHVQNVYCVDKFSDEAFGQAEKKIKDYICDDINKTAGLPTSIILGVGARVMVRSNIDVMNKICNGVTGTVKCIKFKASARAPLPDPVDPTLTCHSVHDIEAVYILFDSDKVGRSTKHICNKWCTKYCELEGTVPITPVEKRFKCKKARKTNVWLKRFQLPLTLCFASTIHKCQGVTLQTAYVDMSGINWRAGMAYTAISRLTSLSGLFLISFDTNSIKTDQTIVEEYARLRGLQKITLLDEISDVTEYDTSKSTTKSNGSPSTSTNTMGENNTSNPTKRPLSPDQWSPVLRPTKQSKLSDPDCVKNDNQDSAKNHKVFKSRVPPIPTFPAEPPRPEHCVGKAHVIDFFEDIQSKNVASQLRDLGFQVRETIDNIQYGPSCGYIASRVVAKLASLTCLGADWFNTSLTDCNYYGPNSHDSQLDMVIIANINLGLPGTAPHFLSSSECVQLIPLYSFIMYNVNLTTINLHSLNIEQPISISTFLTTKLETLYSEYTQDAKSTAPMFFIVNSSDGSGTHWFVVALQFIAPTPPPQNEL